MTRSWWSKEERKVFQEEGQPMEEYFMYRREREKANVELEPGKQGAEP